jgi:hypothetical protein
MPARQHSIVPVLLSPPDISGGPSTDWLPPKSILPSKVSGCCEDAGSRPNDEHLGKPFNLPLANVATCQ